MDRKETIYAREISKNDTGIWRGIERERRGRMKRERKGKGERERNIKRVK